MGLGGMGHGWSWGELGVEACGGVGLGVGLNSWGEELWLHSKLSTCTGHAWCYRQGQSELAVWCLLSSGVGGGSDRISGEVIGSSV